MVANTSLPPIASTHQASYKKHSLIPVMRIISENSADGSECVKLTSLTMSKSFNENSTSIISDVPTALLDDI
jgi:hypothetical protein